MIYFDANLMVDLLRIECARRAAERERRRAAAEPPPEASAEKRPGRGSPVRDLPPRPARPTPRRR